MKGDYGFRSGAGRLYEEQYGEVPGNIFQLAVENFRSEWVNMRRSFVRDEFSEISDAKDDSKLWNKATLWLGEKFVRGLRTVDGVLVKTDVLRSIDEFDEPGLAENEVRAALKGLKLDAHKVSALEKARFAESPPTAPWFIKVPYFALCFLLDVVYEGRPIQRFWVLEEVARMPYFAYISMLHLYESLGWWRAGAALRKVHFAEEWNELHHLQIMEALGGDNAWIDRFVAQHAAIVYYWFLIIFYAFSPKYAYAFSDLVEGHATDTYEEFASQNEAQLKALPPPAVAVEYYLGSDVYMFESFQTSKEVREQPRRPTCDNLYDVFINIRDDEIEHKKTMVACQDPRVIAGDIQAAARLR